ncbi:hypothetical protein [Teichococcus vastitatis]|uniref:hypothetical protein n=1 Tax=Teichococcus vastitatis TaxID=2307076 RepID=UPI000E740B0F|nr:hypothetical protein [Pseudoroseomonas vastitatis]
MIQMFDVRGNALKLLQRIYAETRGDQNHDVKTAGLIQQMGLDARDGQAAAGYLIKRRLVEDLGLVSTFPVVFITADGIDQIERALRNPQQGSDFFPPAVQILQIQSMSGGVVQQGSQASPVTQNNHAGIDLSALATQLGTLCAALAKEATLTEHYVAVGQIASAQIAANEGNPEKVGGSLRMLGKAGQWVTDKADKIGTTLVIEALKRWPGSGE